MQDRCVVELGLVCSTSVSDGRGKGREGLGTRGRGAGGVGAESCMR